LSQLNEGVSLNQLASQAQVERDELSRVLHALSLADLVEVRTVQVGRKVVVLETDPQLTLQLRGAADAADCPFAMKVVRDRLSLQLVLKRQKPDVVVVALDTEVGQQVAQELLSHERELVWLGIVSQSDQADAWRDRVDEVLLRPFDTQELFNAIEQTWARRQEAMWAGV
jgi:DNA-binding response OmpR family regulator